MRSAAAARRSVAIGGGCVSKILAAAAHSSTVSTFIHGAIAQNVTIWRRSHQQNKCDFTIRRNCPRERSGSHRSAGRLFHSCCPTYSSKCPSDHFVANCAESV